MGNGRSEQQRSHPVRNYNHVVDDPIRALVRKQLGIFRFMREHVIAGLGG